VVRPRFVRAGVVASVLAIAAVALPLPAKAASSASTVVPRHHHNILFVLTDDMALGDLSAMPETQALLADHGATFDNYFVNSSACCPSRATTLRGQFEHNTGVLSNGGANGGFEKAYRSGIEHDTIATRLQKAGYRTGLFGKYLNGYPNSAPETYVPPGWTDWASPVKGNAYGEYDYTLNQNGTLHSYGHDAASYGTDVYMGLANQFIRDSADAKHPFFAYVSVYAPHEPATPAPPDLPAFAGTAVPRTPAYNQADVSAMPRFVRELPPLDATSQAQIDTLARLRLQSLQAVDRGVASLVDTLRSVGELHDTDIVFTSDNGFHLGQHRLPAGKLTAYDTDIHVPLLVRGPGIAPASHVRAMAGNVDLAPTFAAMAHVHAASFTDGRSLLEVARQAPGASRRWRQAYLVEHRNVVGTSNPARPKAEAGGLALEPPDPDESVTTTVTMPASKLKDRSHMAHDAHIVDYDAVRTSRYLYVKYSDGERELYDVRADPEEIHNLAGASAVRSVETLLDRQLEDLRHCEAGGCRRADARTLRELASQSA
jgi:arylsulfatase A-like enzyme